MNQYHLQNRPNREISNKVEIEQLLKKGKYTVISMCRDNEPYIVTLSYGFHADTSTLYFHCANKGLKLDFLAANSRVCATVVKDKGYVHNECAHEYESLVFWGKMQVVSSLAEKQQGMLVLLQHLEKDASVIKKMQLKSDAVYSKMEILKLEIDQIHGKAGR